MMESWWSPMSSAPTQTDSIQTTGARLGFARCGRERGNGSGVLAREQSPPGAVVPVYTAPLEVGVALDLTSLYRRTPNNHGFY